MLALVLAAGALAACGATPAEAGAGNSDPPGTRADTSGTPTTAPGGGPNSTSLSHSLTGIDPAKLPSTAQAVANVLAKLPAAVNGHPSRRHSDR